MDKMNSELFDGFTLLTSLMDRAPGTPEETLESAGCTGQCPMYPGAPKTEDGYPDCSKCPEVTEE